MSASEPARAQASPGAIVLRRLNGVCALAEETSDAVLGLNHIEAVRAGGSLAPADARAQRFLIAGWACRTSLLRDGRRQILSFVLPGDSVDAFGPSRPLNRGSLRALTAVQLIDARALTSFGSLLDQAFFALAAQEEHFLLNQIVRLGRCTAYERMMHLLLELYDRLAAMGLAKDDKFVLPLTQEVLADALGLSVVHVNRVLQQLRRERLVEIGRGHDVRLASERIRMLCDFTHS